MSNYLIEYATFKNKLCGNNWVNIGGDGIWFRDNKKWETDKEYSKFLKDYLDSDKKLKELKNKLRE